MRATSIFFETYLSKTSTLQMAGRISAAAYPLLAIGCAALILFTIAAAIVLGLIPLYLPSKSVTLASISSA